MAGCLTEPEEKLKGSLLYCEVDNVAEGVLCVCVCVCMCVCVCVYPGFFHRRQHKVVYEYSYASCKLLITLVLSHLQCICIGCPHLH